MISIYQAIRNLEGYIEEMKVVKKVVPSYIEMVDYENVFEQEYKLGFASVKLIGDDYEGYLIKKEEADKL